MKYAEDIIKEIEEREKIDLNKGIIDDGWEDYIRGNVNHIPICKGGRGVFAFIINQIKRITNK